MIEFQHVSKSFKENTVLRDLNFEIPEGKLTVLIGPSGCGKTTTLKMINRLIRPTEGKILIDGNDIETVDKVELRRSMGYVIQQGGLFPHMTVRQNIEIIEKLEDIPEEERAARTSELMDMVGLHDTEFLDRYPRELSGGQQQRIGVARAFATNPDIILFDEPFSALDPITRGSLQDQLLEIQEKEAKTMVFVTHDMDEAIKIADEICIMHDGRIVQFDTPEQILRHPSDDFVVDFIGPNRIWSNPEYLKVRDFMLPDPVVCHKQMPVTGCIRLIRTKHVDSVFVVDEEQKFLGIVDRRSFTSDHRSFWTAADVMMEPDFTVNVDDSIMSLLEKASSFEQTRPIPVLNDNGTLCGIMTSSVLISLLSRQYLSSEDSMAEGGLA